MKAELLLMHNVCFIFQNVLHEGYKVILINKLKSKKVIHKRFFRKDLFYSSIHYLRVAVGAGAHPSCPGEAWHTLDGSPVQSISFILSINLTLNVFVSNPRVVQITAGSGNRMILVIVLDAL